jgi:hypothetical protein
MVPLNLSASSSAKSGDASGGTTYGGSFSTGYFGTGTDTAGLVQKNQFVFLAGFALVALWLLKKK